VPTDIDAGDDEGQTQRRWRALPHPRRVTPLAPSHHRRSDIGLLLPCNVVVREQPDKKINVGFMDPIAVLKLTDNPAITEMAKEVRGRLERVRDKLSHG
jgi:hypothetical protein